MEKPHSIGYAPNTPKHARKLERAHDVSGSIFSSIFWYVAGIFVFGLLFFSIYSTIPFALIVAPLISILLVTSASLAVRHLRKQRSMAILGYLHQAIRLDLPLPTMLASATSAERGQTRKRINELNVLLQLGLPVHKALQLGVPETSDRALGLIATAEANGTLSQTLQRLLDENRNDGPIDAVKSGFYRAYPLAVSLVFMLVLTLFMIFVMPKYEQIFRDFGVQLPAITIFVLNFSYGAMLPVTLILLLASMYVIAKSVEQVFVVRSASIPFFIRLRDRLMWWLPIAHQSERDRGLADIFQTMSDAVKNGQPFTHATAEASRLRVNVVLTSKLNRLRYAIESGKTPTNAASEARFPAIVVGLLATARAHDDTAAVLAFLARYYRSRFSRLQILLTGMVVPGLALFMGLCVGVVAVAMFLPLHYLIEATSTF